MDMQEALVIGAKLGMGPGHLVNVDDLSGHLLDGLRIEADKPFTELPQGAINARFLVSLLDMHARLKELEDMWQRE